MASRLQKITFGEMRQMGVRGLLVYCSDYHCSHWTVISADRWSDDVRLSDLEPLFVCQACGTRPAELRPDFEWNKAQRGNVQRPHSRRETRPNERQNKERPQLGGKLEPSLCRGHMLRHRWRMALNLKIVSCSPMACRRLLAKTAAVLGSNTSSRPA